MASEEVDSEQRTRSESVLTEKPTIEERLESLASAPTNSDADILSPGRISPSGPTSSGRLKVITDTALRFVANASNEALGACAIGLAASTYLVLGRLGLVLIGAFGGVLLQATWDNHGEQGGQGNTPEAVQQRKKELGIEIVKRALDWRDVRKGDAATADKKDKVEASTTRKTLDFSEFPTEIATALTAFSDAVIRDYVKWWYSPILPAEEIFPGDCRQILVAFIQSFSSHVSRKRAADPVLDFLANSTSVLIVFLQELAVALKASQRQEPEEAIKTYLKFQPDSNLANVLDREQQTQKLHLVADDILQSFLDSKTYNCLPAKSFLSEVLAGLILDGTLVSCSRPEWINEWIVYLLEEGEPELLNAIDAGVSELEEKVKAVGEPSSTSGHKRRMSRAEQAMQEAMLEAQRMNDMIAEENARKKQSLDNEDTMSTTTSTTNNGIVTPSSSGSDYHAQVDGSGSGAMVFDSEGNAIPSVTSSPVKQTVQTFTNFDQLEQLQPPTALRTTSEAPMKTEAMLAIPLTLHNASINIMDMGAGNDQVPMRQKPEDDMLIQIEPAGGRYPGWIVTRQYPAFEPLSETLRRIAHISGVQEFNLQFPDLPPWRGRSRASVIADLEKYLKAALKSDRLAESEAMKRFLEKDTGLDKIPASQKNVFVQGGAALQDVGKGFVNVLGQGGKGLQTGFQAGGKVFQTGGKAVLGGVTGVFGAVASNVPKRPGLSPMNSSLTQNGSGFSPRASQDLARPNADFDPQARGSPRPSASTRSSSDILRTSRDFQQQAMDFEGNLNLPPPPDEITDNYVPANLSTTSRPTSTDGAMSSRPSTPTSIANNTLQSNLPTAATTTNQSSSSPSKNQEINPPILPTKPESPKRPQDIPVTDEETRMTVELMFALITELFSLSSAWTFRLSLLTAAKSYLLRPKNPQLTSIRLVLQESIIESNLSESGIAGHIYKLRENALPTEEELKKWPKEASPEEKERLRVKARKLLVEKGMPAALNSVVGAAASGEALGKVFDCLQNREVARGLIFALMLQALRTVTQ